MVIINMTTQSIKIEINLVRLEEERIRNGYALSDISYILGYKTPSGYWLIEHGERKITAQALYVLSKLYDKPMEYFIIEK